MTIVVDGSPLDGAKPVLLSARGVSKSFGGIQALRSVDLELRAGEVHAIVGENGAGKSTLTKILSGMLDADAGSIAVAGVPTIIQSPAHAARLGIAVIHQELELAGALSVAENLFLGRLPRSRGFVHRRELLARSRELLRPFGCEINPDRKVRYLSIAERQVVEIAKATRDNVRIVFLDEPTATLSPAETVRVHDRVRLLRDQGVAIVYISHHLDDVLAISDRITVMRDGSKVADVLPSITSRPALIQLILGRDLEQTRRRNPRAPASNVVLSCSDLSVPRRIGPLSFHACRGEVIGFFGLVGAGQGVVAEALFGLHPAARGDLRTPALTRLPSHPRQAILGGMGYVPPDRKSQGLALNLSIEENMLLTCRNMVSRLGFVDRKRATAIALRIATRLDLRYATLRQRAGHLSGGNQQKIVLGKWQAKEVSIMLLDQPTRGVDVGARAEIYSILRDQAAKGVTSMVFSSDAEEIHLACDRAYVLRKGVIATELAGAGLSVQALLRAVL